MQKFIEKYGHPGDTPEPWKAIEIICHKLYHVKDKVERGENDIKGLADISDMIDEYIKESQNVQFKPKHYQDIHGEYRHDHHPHDYNPYTTVGRIGYRQYPQDWIYYPMYPFFNDRGDRREMDERYYVHDRGGQGGRK